MAKKGCFVTRELFKCMRCAKDGETPAAGAQVVFTKPGSEEGTWNTNEDDVRMHVAVCADVSVSDSRMAKFLTKEVSSTAPRQNVKIVVVVIMMMKLDDEVF